MKHLIVPVFILLMFSVQGIAQTDFLLTDKTTVYAFEDQLEFENEIAYVDLIRMNLQIGKKGKSISIPLKDGIRYFHFEKTLIDQSLVQSYLITDQRQNFLAEIQFANKDEGQRFVELLKGLYTVKSPIAYSPINE